jgi:hypothetical protein
MKKKLLNAVSLTTAVFCVVVYVACSKHKENALEKGKDFENPLNIIGQYHNKGLDYILKNYNSSLKLKNLQDTVKQIVNILDKFAETIPQGTILNNNIIDYQKLEDEAYNRFLDNKKKNLNSIRALLTEQQNNYVNEIKEVLKNQNIEDSALVFQTISKIENDIWVSNMTENEKYVTLTAAAVGKYSWIFWSANPAGNSKSVLNPTLRQAVAEADVDGAIVGAIGGCIGGAIFGTLILPGVGSLTACMLEAVNLGFQGAVIGSTYAALKYLFFK